MMRFLTGILLLAVLAGCASETTDDASRPIPAPAAVEPEVDWRTSLVGGMIVVELIDTRGFYRVVSVELVGPGGRSYPAYELSRESVRESARAYGGGVGVGAGYGSGGHGSFVFGFSVPLASPRRAAAITRTTARLKRPDRYRPTAGKWVINIVLTDPPGTERFASIPAPEPTN